MPEEEKNKSNSTGAKKPLMSEEQYTRLYGLFFAIMDIQERQKICEMELSELIQAIYPVVGEEQQKEFRKHFCKRFPE